jgi:hypothetical protein
MQWTQPPVTGSQRGVGSAQSGSLRHSTHWPEATRQSSLDPCVQSAFDKQFMHVLRDVSHFCTFEQLPVQR